MMLEEGVIPPFYLDKIRDDQGTRAVSALTMSILFLILIRQAIFEENLSSLFP